MRYWLAEGVAQRFTYFAVLAGWGLLYSSLSVAQSQPHFEFSLGADYRLAEFDWNIAGDLSGASPNILSELTWSDLEIAQVTAAARMDLGRRVILQINGDYGQIISGNNQDSDYAGDNRTAEFSRSNNTSRGNVDDVSLALGYPFRVFDMMVGKYALITPLIGYSVHHQNFVMKDGVQTIPASGPFSGLNSSYNAQWVGPWLGMNMRLQANARTMLFIDMGYHWADYQAEANWNLRDDLTHPVSYRHSATGQGVVAALAVSRTLSKRWEVLMRIEAQRWTTEPGVDVVYEVDATTKAIQASATRLNEVNWKSHALGVAAIFHF